MPHEAVDEVVLGGMRFVGDHDDIAPVGEHGVAVAFLFREELVNGREDHATRGDRQQLAQVRAALAARLRPADLAAGGTVLDGHTVDEQPMHRAIAGDGLGAVGPRELPERIGKCFRRQAGIQRASRTRGAIRRGMGAERRATADRNFAYRLIASSGFG